MNEADRHLENNAFADNSSEGVSRKSQHSTHKSANTHAGTVCVPRDLDL